MSLGVLASFASQVLLVSLLVYVSSLASSGHQHGRVGKLSDKGLQYPRSHSKSVAWREQGVSEPLLLQKTKWMVHVALIRHIVVIASVLWHITNTPSPPALSFGLLLLAIMLLLHGIAAVLVSMTGFERHVATLYPIAITSLHPLSLLTVLLPHMLPGVPSSGSVALFINHAVFWLLAPVRVGKGDSLHAVMRLEAAAAVYVCALGALQSLHAGIVTVVREVLWQAVLALWGGVLIPYAAIFLTQEMSQSATPERAPQPMSMRAVTAFTLASALLEGVQHVPTSHVLCTLSRRLLGCEPPKLLHSPVLLHLSLLLLLAATAVNLAGALSVTASRAAAAQAKGNALRPTLLSVFRAMYANLSPAQQSALSTFGAVLVAQLAVYASIYDYVRPPRLAFARLGQGSEDALMGALLCGGALLQAACVRTLAAGVAGERERERPEKDAAAAAAASTPRSSASRALRPTASEKLRRWPWLHLCTMIMSAEALEPAEGAEGPSERLPQGSGIDSWRPSHSFHVPPGQQAGPTRYPSGSPVPTSPASHLASPRAPRLHSASIDSSMRADLSIAALETRHSASLRHMQSGRGDPFEQRVAALTSFKQFMSFADSSYSSVDMLRGSALAVESMFPGVRHMGISILTSDRAHTNNYTLIGDGALKRPRRRMPLSKGTVSQYVIRKCQPVYIDDCEAFAESTRSFTDVQFMRFVLQVKSVACVPIISTGNVCFGCLLFGFYSPRLWDSRDKQLCTQLASIVAQYHHKFEAMEDSDAELENALKSRGTSDKLGGPGSSREHKPLTSMGSYDLRTEGSGTPLRSEGSMRSEPRAEAPRGGEPRPQPQPRRQQSSRQTLDSFRQQPVSRSRESLSHPSVHSLTSPRSEMLVTKGSYWDDEMTTSAEDAGTDRTAEVPPADGASDASGLSDDLLLQEVSELNSAATNDGELRILELIGAGGFGNVYRALWQRQIVAVKIMEHGEEALGFAPHHGALNVDSDKDDNCRKALFEGAMSSAISHPNVVTTYDYLVKKMDKGGSSTRRIMQETQIIMEYCDRGSLSDIIERGVFHRSPAGDGKIDMEAVLVTLLEVAHAVEYLHSLQITHRDLKPKNILLKSSNKDRRGFTAKVSDFGLSQVLSDKSKPHVTSKYSGTITHMPPELIENGLVFAAGDVYAFGIIMWECYTKLTPYKGLVHPQIMMGVVSSCLRPAFPSTCPAPYRMLAEACWQQDPEARPTFHEVAKNIRALLHATV